jgi:hypothetical protein
MIDEIPLPAPEANPSLACPQAAGDGHVWGCGHVLNQIVTSKDKGPFRTSLLKLLENSCCITAKNTVVIVI